MEDNKKMNAKEIFLIIDMILKAGEAVSDCLRTKPYGIIHKSALITYCGKKGRLVWDYILWNELTFEDLETGDKYSLANRFSDAEAEAFFNDYVSRYGD